VAVCQHERMDSDAVPQADIATVPPTFDESVVLLDVREDDEWAAAHAPGAVHIPMGRLTPDNLPAGRPVYCICRSGNRSARVVDVLTAAGIDARNVVGGMHAWVAAGLPVAG
jgi:rhodanese-related sulfurtransferase